MRILTFTTLYPNNMQPDHGLFVEHRLANFLEQQKEYEANVVAPVPWFPAILNGNTKYGKYPQVSRTETRRGIDIFHPRYPALPKIGMSIAPMLIAGSCVRAIRQVISAGWDFDVIDAHYFYPDGVAATVLGKWFRKPVVITARGTDINLIPKYRVPRWQIQWAIRECAKMITVCEALRDSLVSLGAEPEKVVTLRNGVDLDLFVPRDRNQARARLDLPNDKKLILSVGHLVERKGHHLVIDALAKLDRETQLLIVGNGEERVSLQEQAARLDILERVRFCGSVTQSELPWYYSAADALVLASSREGMANVLLESIACGTPVAATNIWGTPEVIRNGVSGQLIDRRSPDGIAEAVHKLLSMSLLTDDIREFAEGFSWESTSNGQLTIFRNATGAGVE